MIDWLLHELRNATVVKAGGLFLIANFSIFVSSVALCWMLGKLFPAKRIFDRWEPVRGIEIAAAIGSVVLNSAVSLIGWSFWVHGSIELQTTTWVATIRDCLLMILFMDFGMYVFHRLAHHPWIYARMHRFHHRHVVTNPISLFVLHPLEVLGFAGLMTIYLMLIPVSVGGLMAYLTINVLWGTMGHCGVEPFPTALLRWPALRLVGTSTFHAEHHENPTCNFGFYTLIWDKLFGTMDPNYIPRFSQAPPAQGNEAES